MPRQSNYQTCTKCGDKVKVCAYVSYYAVGRQNSGAKQLTGVLPTAGYCLRCFLWLASEEGVSRCDVLELRDKLQDTPAKDARK
jgi:hypothetical protein